jgi:CheY-like chemotaxis protein
MITPLKILIVEDNHSDADLLCRELKKSGLEFVCEVVQTRKGYEQALESYQPDLILSDYSLPSFDAVSAFKIKQVNHPLTPFIIISGVIGEENAVELSCLHYRLR